MLIMISNRCDEGCPHCLQESREDGGLMSLETFCEAVVWAESMGCRVVLISGGEPTENPLMEQMLQRLDMYGRHTGMRFSILTNGTWIEDAEKHKMMWRITKMKAYIGMQVYTNKQWYRDYDFIQDWRKELEQIPGCVVDDKSRIFMQDLGRARTDAVAQKEVEENPYYCSCLNACLVARQVQNPFLIIPMLEQSGKFCTPLIDIDGNIHMSESHLCPSVANLYEHGVKDIFLRMREFKPCMRCKNSKRLLLSEDPKIVRAREILGIERF